MRTLGSVPHNIDKLIDSIIKHYTIDNEFILKNSADEKWKYIHVGEDQTLVSYDFVSLYTSVPQDQAMNLVKDKLFRDPELSERTKIPAKSIMDQWEIVINNTSCSFNGKLYKQ
jgi:hypothetical protein